jgi:redox-sensing transcriptional repressor
MSAMQIPSIVVHRLPLYLRILDFMERQGKHFTSSQELGDQLGISSAQIRKDLSYFGEFGKQGTGYEVSFLRRQLRYILQVDRVWDVVLVGAGALGTAIAHYGGFEHRGFRIVAIFDVDPEKVGRPLAGFTVQHVDQMKAVVREMGLKVAIVAVPAEEAPKVVDELVDAGVEAILNYAPITLTVPGHVKIEYIDPAMGLQSMSYYLGRTEDPILKGRKEP